MTVVCSALRCVSSDTALRVFGAVGFMMENPSDPKTLLLCFLLRMAGKSVLGSPIKDGVDGDDFGASSGLSTGGGMGRLGRLFFDLSFPHHVPVHFGDSLGADSLMTLLGALFESKLSVSRSVANEERETTSE